MDPNSLTELQLDALREVNNIGCGAAATALSQLLTNRHVNLEVTRSAIISLSDLVILLGGPDETRVVILLALRGGFEGHLLLSYSNGDAVDLAGILAGSSATENSHELSDMGKSALMEVGNIVGSAFLNAVGKVSEMILLPSVPTLIHDPNHRIVEQLASLRVQEEEEISNLEEKLLVLETRLSIKEASGIQGTVIIIPKTNGLSSFLRKLGMKS